MPFLLYHLEAANPIGVGRAIGTVHGRVDVSRGCPSLELAAHILGRYLITARHTSAVVITEIESVEPEYGEVGDVKLQVGT